jgi:hypothetical protein
MRWTEKLLMRSASTVRWCPIAQWIIAFSRAANDGARSSNGDSMRQRHGCLIGLSALFLCTAVVAAPGTGWSQTLKEGNSMSQSNSGPVDPAVAKALAKYDADRDLASLQSAGDEAARHDGEAVDDPAQAHARGMQRLADWSAIFARFKRDIDPNFDPDKRPSIRITPPGPEGLQYMPGVDPKDVEDPVLREKYIAAIKKNNELIRDYAFLSKLERLHRVMLEKATKSVADAHQTLGLSSQEIAGVLQKADMQPGDQKALLAAAGA